MGPACHSDKQTDRHLDTPTQGLWRGTLPGQLLTVPYTAVQFVTLQQVRYFAHQSGMSDAMGGKSLSFVSGAMAGAAATIAAYPFDILRTTLAAQGEPKVQDVLHIGYMSTFTSTSIKQHLWKIIGSIRCCHFNYSGSILGTTAGVPFHDASGTRRSAAAWRQRPVQRSQHHTLGDHTICCSAIWPV